ncbi:MAG TPA: methyltransferase domain-containing protein [Burkholderiales bacterium]|nr:methyltransferase domain-containing protein [Burkholderiales bacterium]
MLSPESPSTANWFDTPLGGHLLDCEQSYFDEEVANVFGFNAFQIGLPQHDFLRSNRMQLRCTVALDPGARIRSEYELLPITSSCADLVILPHVLEFSDNPHQVLREVSRILMPEGHVIVSGFNPWSLWGLRRLLDKHRNEYPWNGQFIALTRLKDWMALLGFEIAAGHMGAYAPPLRSEKWLRRFDFMEAAGDRWWPFAGGVYFLHGIKRVHGMRVITPQWKTSMAKSKRFAPVPHRVKDDEQLVAKQRKANDRA